MTRRILHIHFGRDGGAERFLVTLAGAFARRGIEQAAIIRPDRPWAGDLSAHADILEGTYRRYLPTRFLMEARLHLLLARFRPDVVMAWMSRGCRLLPRRTAALRVARLGDYPSKLAYFGNTDLIVCNAPDITRHVRALGWRGAVETISNFTALAAAEPLPRADLGVPADGFVVAGVGRFVPRKGFDLLIRATARTAGAHLVLVGDGEERQPLETLARALGAADRVRFLGWQATPGPILAAADVVVMPSRHEPLGNVVLEAWGAGRPVVATRSEGPSWLIEDDTSGLLVDVDDEPALAAALGRLRDDAALRARLVEGGAAALAARFSEAGVTDAYLAAFERGAGLRRLSAR